MTRVGLLVAGLFVAGFLGGRLARLRPAEPPQGARALAGGDSHWAAQGFFEIVPPVRLPLERPRTSATKVYLYLPPGAELDVVSDPVTGAPRLRLPVGAVADRVAWRGERVADVRGAELVDGGQRYRAFRPFDGERPGLWGYVWPAAPGLAPEEVRSGFAAGFARGLGFLRDPPDRAAAASRLDALLDCEGCHRPLRTERLDAVFTGPRRATDPQGFHVPESVLRDDAPLEAYRARDPNAGDPFVDYICPSGQAPSGTLGSTARACPGGRAPRVRYRLKAALAAGEAHARAVCESRARLASAMSARARAAYAGPLSDCGL